MMIQTSVIFCIVFAILGYLTEQKILNPVTVICTIWGMIIYLSSLMLFTLHEAQDEIYRWILWGLISYIIGYYTVRFFLKNGKIRFKVGKHPLTYDVMVSYQRVYILYYICIGYILYRITRYGAAIIRAGFNLSAIGAVMSEANIGDTGLINAIGFLIATPLFLPLTVFLTVDFWMGKRDKKTLILTIIMTLGRIVIYGGRHPVIQLFTAMVIALTFSYSKYQNQFYEKAKSFGKKKGLLPTVVVGALLFGYLTFTKTTAVSKTLYLDFAMQPYMLQYWAESIGNQYAFGFASLFGFIHPILYVLKNLFHVFSDFPDFFAIIYNNIQGTFNNWIPIGTTLKANAYASSFWYLYYDGRIFGIVLGMFIWGIVSYVSFIKAKRYTSLLNVANYIMMSEAIIYTFTDMEFYKASYVLGFFYLNLLIYRKDYRKKITG